MHVTLHYTLALLLVFRLIWGGWSASCALVGSGAQVAGLGALAAVVAYKSSGPLQTASKRLLWLQALGRKWVFNCVKARLCSGAGGAVVAGHDSAAGHQWLDDLQRVGWRMAGEVHEFLATAC